jgi:hypothetical protein
MPATRRSLNSSAWKLNLFDLPELPKRKKVNTSAQLSKKDSRAVQPSQVSKQIVKQETGIQVTQEMFDLIATKRTASESK